MYKLTCQNKLAFFLCFLLSMFACKKSSSPPITPPPNSDVHLTQGLLVYLPFTNGSAADSSGNSNSTTLTGGSINADRNGNPNSAFDGSGNGERVIVTNNGSIVFDTAFSVSLDFMLRDSRMEGLASMVNNSNALGPTFVIETNFSGPDFIFATVDKSGDCASFDAAATTIDTSSFVPQASTWYNLVTIFHKGKLDIYINGSLVQSKTGGGQEALLCPGSQFIAGGWWDGGPISINGKLDNVRMYNRVLNADEIAELSKSFK